MGLLFQLVLLGAKISVLLHYWCSLRILCFSYSFQSSKEKFERWEVSPAIVLKQGCNTIIFCQKNRGRNAALNLWSQLSVEWSWHFHVFCWGMPANCRGYGRFISCFHFLTKRPHAAGSRNDSKVKVDRFTRAKSRNICERLKGGQQAISWSITRTNLPFCPIFF